MGIFDDSLEMQSVRWMWGDAGGRCCFSKRLAIENPFRWSGAQSLRTTIEQLQRYQSQHSARPVRMEFVFRRREQSEMMLYPTLLAALTCPSLTHRLAFKCTYASKGCLIFLGSTLSCTGWRST